MLYVEAVVRRKHAVLKRRDYDSVVLFILCKQFVSFNAMLLNTVPSDIFSIIFYGNILYGNISHIPRGATGYGTSMAMIK